MKQQTRGYYPWWHFLGAVSKSLLTCFSLEPLLCSGCCWEDYSLWTLGTSIIWPVRWKPELPMGKHWPMEDSGSRHIKSLSICSSLSIWGHQFSSVQLLSRVQLFVTPWIAAHQVSLSITNSWNSLKLTSIKSVMPSKHHILCRPLFLLPPIPPRIRVFSNESTLHMRWPKYWSFSFSIIPSKEHPGLISFRMDWLDLLAVQGTLKSLLQHHSSKASFFSAQLSSQSNSHIHTWPLEKP